MNVKIIIPESLDDITVGQFQQIEYLLKKEDLREVELDDEILKVILNFDKVDAISVKDRNRLILDIRKALESEGTFKQTFELNGIDFGLIPNFDKITNGEYTDLIKYANDIEDLHRFLAVAYRPIKVRDTFGNYKLVSYDGTSEHGERMKDLPISIAKGVQGFFLTLSNHLENHSLKFMLGELRRE